jgi:hypothetical protein
LSDRSSFQDFFSQWQNENIRPLHDQRIDPSDREYIITQRSKRLEEQARELGYLSDLYQLIGRDRNIRAFVAGLFDRADFRDREKF